MVNTVFLKKGRNKSIVAGNPWVFSGAIEKESGDLTPGSICQVRTADRRLLGTGYYNRASAIRIRLLQWGEQSLDPAWLEQAIEQAITHRTAVLTSSTDSCRMINAEGDFIPGLIVDRFAGGLVVQILTAGMELLREKILAALEKYCTPLFIYERSDTESRLREGLTEREGLLTGQLPDELVVKELGLAFAIDIVGGQKTGFYFDQRINRALLQTYAAGRTVCDCFSYSGPFTVHALAGGAVSVDAVDRSVGALERIDGNVAKNGFDTKRVTTTNADVFSYLREVDKGYDCIVLDPPKFAKHPGEVDRAARGYKDINLLALKNVNPGGVVFTFSCSQAVDTKLFRQIVFAAASDAKRKVQLLHQLTAGPDHPVNLAHREGEYLKGLVVRVVA